MVAYDKSEPPPTCALTRAELTSPTEVAPATVMLMVVNPVLRTVVLNLASNPELPTPFLSSRCQSALHPDSAVIAVNLNESSRDETFRTQTS